MTPVPFITLCLILVLMIMLKNTLTEIKKLKNDIEYLNTYYKSLLKKCKKYLLPKSELRNTIDNILKEKND